MIKNPVPWPNGMRCAVAFTFDMDAESLLHLYHRETAPDRIALSSMLRYGTEVAVPRLLDIYARHDIRQTFFVPGWCVENYPSTIDCILEGGHEIGHHGYLHKRPNLQERSQEQESLIRGIEAIVRATGKRPSGYRAPGYAFSGNTLGLLQEQGFFYDASLFGNDVPYLIGNEKGDLIELPTDLSLDDWPQYVNLGEFNYSMPIASPGRAMEVFRAEFDAAWRHGGLWVSVWHPFVSGRLARAEAIADLIEYMRDKGGVWFASMHEIATHVRKVIADGLWKPRRDILPFWPLPMPKESPV
jgi:peptidoglycan/xylan/chitin deacetylase (PgdA/CDA1 family)